MQNQPRVENSSIHFYEKLRITLCSVDLDDGYHAVGISLCSFQDTWSAERGALVSMGRAHKRRDPQIFRGRMHVDDLVRTVQVLHDLNYSPSEPALLIYGTPHAQYVLALHWLATHDITLPRRVQKTLNWQQLLLAPWDDAAYALYLFGGQFPSSNPEEISEPPLAEEVPL